MVDKIQLPRLNWHTYHDEESLYEDMIEIEGYEKKNGYYDVDNDEYVEETFKQKTFCVPKETLLDILKELMNETTGK